MPCASDDSIGTARCRGLPSYSVAHPTMPPTAHRSRRRRGPMTESFAALDAATEAHLQATGDARLASYLDFIRIPSISALPVHAADCREAAGWLADALRTAGAEHVEVAETGGHPVVYGDWLHAEGAPTALLYGHYDVQPVDPLEQWTSPPFEPVVVGDRVLGRGAADDKANIHLHLMATQALLATRGALPINVRFVFEGEEESGSTRLDRLARGEPRPSRLRRRDRQRHRLLRGQRPGDHDGPARPDVRPGRRPGLAGRSPLGWLRRRRREPGQRARADHRLAQGSRRSDPHPRLLRRRRAAHRRRPGGLRRAAVRRCHPRRDDRRAGARRRGRLHGPRTTRRSADARRERDLGRLPGGGEQDHHPGRGPRQDQLSPRGRPGSRADLRALPRFRAVHLAARRDDDRDRTSAAASRR